MGPMSELGRTSTPLAAADSIAAAAGCGTATATIAWTIIQQSAGLNGFLRQLRLPDQHLLLGLGNLFQLSAHIAVVVGLLVDDASHDTVENRSLQQCVIWTGVHRMPHAHDLVDYFVARLVLQEAPRQRRNHNGLVLPTRPSYHLDLRELAQLLQHRDGHLREPPGGMHTSAVMSPS